MTKMLRMGNKSCTRAFYFLLMFFICLFSFNRPADSFSIRSLTTTRVPVFSNQKIFISSFQRSQHLLAAEMEGSEAPTRKKKKKLFITMRIHVISIFVITNYYVRPYFCWPGILLRLSLKVWNLIHGLSAMIFAGSIITTTLLEWNPSNIIAFFPRIA